MRTWLLTICFGVFAVAAAAMPAAMPAPGHEPRVALVIGNSAYETPGWSLENPARDAQIMKAALEGLGFDVDIVLNADEDQMEQAFSDFGARLREAARRAEREQREENELARRVDEVEREARRPELCDDEV